MSPSPPVSSYTSTSPATSTGSPAASTGSPATSTGSPASAPEPSAPSAAFRMAVVLALDSATLGWSNGLIRSARPATAVAGRALRINPFDQPNVAEAKADTTAILDAADGAGGSGALAG